MFRNIYIKFSGLTSLNFKGRRNEEEVPEKDLDEGNFTENN